MVDLVTEVIHVEEEFRRFPEHFSWIGDLNAVWMLATGRLDHTDIKWNATPLDRRDPILHGNFFYDAVSLGDGGISVSNRIFCVKDKEAVLQNRLFYM